MNEHTMESVITVLIGLLIVSVLGDMGVLIIVSLAIYLIIKKISIHDFNKFIINSIKKILNAFSVTEKKSEQIANEVVDNTIMIGKQIKNEVVKQIKQIKMDLKKSSNNDIKNYIDKAIREAIIDKKEFTEKEVVSKMSTSMDNSYEDILERINNKILENNEVLTDHISSLISNYMKNTKEDDSANEEVSKAIDKGMNEYNQQIKELINVQMISLKDEIESNIDKQLCSVKDELKNNNIDIEKLEAKLKSYANSSMKNYRNQNTKNMKKILGDITQNFDKLKNEMNYKNLNIEIKNTLEEFKENNLTSIQENIDETLEIVKSLGKFNITNFEIIKNEKIREKLEEAFEIAEHEIDIISPWISDKVMDDSGVEALICSVLKRNVEVKIVYGIGNISSNYVKEDYRNRRTEEIAQNLKLKFSKNNYLFKIKRKNTHSKILICDNKFAIIGSFNFLSFDGKYKNDIRDEVSAIVTDYKIIEELRSMEFDF